MINGVPKAKTFHNLLQLKPVKLHPTPKNVPSLEDWPLVKKLHVPASTKSFLLKLYMNALPTSDRLAFMKGPPILCPLCNNLLTSFHFFSESCALENYSAKIYNWCEKHLIPKPRFSIDFNDSNVSLLNLIFINTLWKTVCTARHAKSPNVFRTNYKFILPTTV